MALAPTLLTYLNVAVAVGAVSIGGQIATVEIGARNPAQGSVSVSGLAPTIQTQLGPTADPETGEVTVEGRVPDLLRTLIVAPGLPDTEPETNDLTPTLVWQDTPLPGVGAISVAGLAPAVVGDTGQNIAISVGSASIIGLAPTVEVSLGEQTTKSPDKAETVIEGLEPTLYLELSLAVTSNQSSVPSISGLAPTLSVQVGWTDVPRETDPSWTTIEPV